MRWSRPLKPDLVLGRVAVSTTPAAAATTTAAAAAAAAAAASVPSSLAYIRI